jgi:membrane protein required for colicin V production
MLAETIFDNLSTLDGLILLFLGWGAYKGYKKGLIVEIISLLIFILLLIIIFKLLQTGIDWAEGLPKGVSFSSFLIFFVLAALLVSWVGKLLKGIIHKVLFEGFDNILGALFGIFKYAVAIAILLQLFTHVGAIKPSTLQHSIFYPSLIRASELASEGLSRLIPQFQELVNAIQKQLHQ